MLDADAVPTNGFRARFRPRRRARRFASSSSRPPHRVRGNARGRRRTRTSVRGRVGGGSLAPRWGGRSRGVSLPRRVRPRRVGGCDPSGFSSSPAGASPRPPRPPPSRRRRSVRSRAGQNTAAHARGDRDGRGGGGERAPPLLPRRVRGDWGTSRPALHRSPHALQSSARSPALTVQPRRHGVSSPPQDAHARLMVVCEASWLFCEGLRRPFL